VTEAEMREAMARLAQTPVRDIIANHAIGLWELAVLHLGLVEGLGDRLGEHVTPLREALSQLRVAFVQIKQAVEGGTFDPATTGPGATGSSASPTAPPAAPDK
jgi:hypothetical protein